MFAKRYEAGQAIRAVIEATQFPAGQDLLFHRLLSNSDLARFSQRAIADALYDLIMESYLGVTKVPRVHINH